MAVEAVPLFDRYVHPELIGRGSLAEVYVATDSLLGRPVALKMLRPEIAADPAARQRFTRAALRAARLSGVPHAVVIYDVSDRHEQPYFVMEHLPGGSVAQRLEQTGAWPVSVVLDWLEQTAQAVDAAHAEGVVHGDLKPGNLLLDAREQITVTDFGIAAAGGAAPFDDPDYLSPEQAWTGTPSTAGDRHSLAVVAFELLSGAMPFATGAGGAARRAASICAVNPSLPCELDDVFAAALADDPRETYRTCGELVAALRSAFTDAAAPTMIVPPRERASEKTAALPVARRARARRHRRAWLWFPAAAIALAALLFGLLGRSAPGERTGRPRVAQRAAAPRAAPGVTGAVAGARTTVTNDPHRLNDQGFARMRSGDYLGALPLLESAVRGLRGRTSDPYDGYANFNLGRDLVELGRCADAVPYLETAKQIEPSRPEVDAALRAAGRCAGIPSVEHS
jgi:serine/threonine-protein kinase